jgi:protein-tyrosine phosphatase
VSQREPFWVETGTTLRLAIVLCPRGGERLLDDLVQIKLSGVDVLVSVLPADETNELRLAAEGQCCAALDIDFRTYPISIQQTPASPQSFAKFIDEVRAEVRAGRSVAVHCRASIGRSSLFLAARMVAEGFTPDDAFKRLSEARGLEVPDTSEQVRWVKWFAAARS